MFAMDLYYKYIEKLLNKESVYVCTCNPEKFREEHHFFCIENNIRGRIIISFEGINGTVSGKIKDCEKYMNNFKKNKLFKNLEFKVDNYNSNALVYNYISRCNE